MFPYQWQFSRKAELHAKNGACASLANGNEIYIYIYIYCSLKTLKEKSKNCVVLTFVNYFKSMSAYCKVAGKPQ